MLKESNSTREKRKKLFENMKGESGRGQNDYNN